MQVSDKHKVAAAAAAAAAPAALSKDEITAPKQDVAPSPISVQG